MRNRFRALALLLVALLALAACSAIPKSSDSVVIGPPGSAPGAGNEGLGIQPGGPEPGSSTDRIVRDFITALTATDVAREYLTPEAAASWTPTDQVTIIEADAATPGATSGKVTFTASRVGRVDSSGTYHHDEGDHTYEFTLEQVQGEWRIANPPESLILDRDGFGALYKPASVYFADPSGTRLVADVRYFRTNVEQRANRLVRALLDGPSSSIEPGVRNELDDPVSLRQAVAYGAEPLTVDLSGLEDKSEGQLRILSAQLMWTLLDLGIEKLRITNNGEPIDIPDVGDVQTDDDWSDYDPNAYPVAAVPYYLDDGALYQGTAEPVNGPVGAGDYSITAAAVSESDTLEQTRVAVVSGDEDPPVLRTGGLTDELDVVDLPGTKTLSEPTWGSSSDEFWIARNGSEIIRVSANGVPKIVDTSMMGDIGTIRSLALSRDGVRLAIIAGDDNKPTRLYLATVQTTADAVNILPAESVAADLEVIDVSWADARTLALLGRSSSPNSRVFPYTVPIDGYGRQSLTAPVLPGDGEVSAIAAAPGRLFLSSINGNVLRLQESDWVPLISGVVVYGSDPLYPG